MRAVYAWDLSERDREEEKRKRDEMMVHAREMGAGGLGFI